MGGLPEPAVGMFTAAGTCPGRLRKPPHTLRPYRPYAPELTAPPARTGPPGDNSPGTGHQAADDRGSCKGPHQTATGLSYAFGPASSADLTAGQRAQVKVPGERESALDTSPSGE